MAVAARLRQETTLSIKQIAQSLGLGRPKGARSNLHKFMNRPEPEGPPNQLQLHRALKTDGLFYGLTSTMCVANLLAIVLVTLWNFWMSALLNWGRTKRPLKDASEFPKEM